MRKLIKFILGISGVLVVGGIVVGCVLGLTNVLQIWNSDTKILKPMNKISFVKYDELSNDVVNSNNNKPFTNYNDALNNWTATYDSLTKTQTGYEDVVTNAIYSFFGNNNNSFFINKKQTANIDGNTYYYGFDYTVPACGIQFNKKNKDVNLGAEYDLSMYLVRASNIKEKYLMWKFDCTSYWKNISFVPTITTVQNLSGQLAFNNNNYYGGIAFSKNTNITDGTLTVLVNKAIFGWSDLGLISKGDFNPESLSNKYLQDIINNQNQPMIKIPTVSIFSMSWQPEINFSSFVSVYNNSYDYGTNI